MADGDDLPDWEYESIYGEDALEARRRARFKAMMAQQKEIQARVEAFTARADEFLRKRENS